MVSSEGTPSICGLRGCVWGDVLGSGFLNLGDAPQAEFQVIHWPPAAASPKSRGRRTRCHCWPLRSPPSSASRRRTRPMPLMEYHPPICHPPPDNIALRMARNTSWGGFLGEMCRDPETPAALWARGEEFTPGEGPEVPPPWGLTGGGCSSSTV